MSQRRSIWSSVLSACPPLTFILTARVAVQKKDGKNVYACDTCPYVYDIDREVSALAVAV